MLSEALRREYMTYLVVILENLRDSVKSGTSIRRCVADFDDGLDLASKVIERVYAPQTGKSEWVIFSLHMHAMVSSFVHLSSLYPEEARAALYHLSALPKLHPAKGASHE